MKRIAYIRNAGAQSGVGHRAVMIFQELLQHASEVQLTDITLNGEAGELIVQGECVALVKPWPGPLGSKSINWLRLGKKLRKQLKGEYDLYHFTNQTLSFLAKKVGPSVVTVHDIIEVLDPQDRKAYFLNKRLYSGIVQADHIICVSQYTKQTVIDYYGVAQEKITVIPNGVSSVFKPLEHATGGWYQRLRQELKLAPEQGPVVLYVGSEHPRKNLATALAVFANIRQQFPRALFLKVGNPGLAEGRKHTLAAIDKLGIGDAVRFIETVQTDEELNEYYNLANVFIYPSTFEGFGLPPLQAMAAGTPVVCSDATSLPEVVDDAAALHEPFDIEEMTRSTQRILEDQQYRDELIQKGLQRAQQFSWSSTAQQELKVYTALTR